MSVCARTCVCVTLDVCHFMADEWQDQFSRNLRVDSPAPSTNDNSTMLPRQCAGPALVCIAASPGLGQLSCSHDPMASSPDCCSW